MLEKVCRNCGSTDVKIVKDGCDLDPVVSYRVYGLRPAGRVGSTRLKAGRKLKLIDKFLGGSLSHIAKHCIQSEVSTWNTIDSMICRDCEFYTIYHHFTDDMLAKLYHDYRSPSYQNDWEQFHPGYIKTTGRFIGGEEESAARLSSMNSYLSRMQDDKIVDFDNIQSILDWGGSDGKMLPHFFQSADRYVYDISNVPATIGVNKLKYIDPNMKFSYIQITHVLEHIFDPFIFMQNPIQALDANGLLYLEVPLECETDGLIDKVLNNQRRLWAHEHINLYNPKSLRALAESCGLRILDLTMETIDFYWCKGPCLRLLATPA